MAAPPLTHHDIVALVAPFSRRGRHVDLAASRRDERVLVFKPPAADAADGDAADAPAEALRLEALDERTFRLTRTWTRADGAQATLQALGRDLEALLAAIESVPASRHFVVGPGWLITRSYTIDPGAGPELRTGRVQLDGLTLTLAVPAVRRVAGDLTLEPAPGLALALPEDVLAVLGWNWARLVPVRQGWTSKLRLRGDPARRTQRAEAALDAAAAHLARTLAEPPARYHERLKRARWGVFFRRGIPTFTALGLFAGVGLFSWLWPDAPMGAWVAMYHVPTVIVAIAFVMQELPRFEIPPLPRALPGETWRRAPDAPLRPRPFGRAAR